MENMFNKLTALLWGFALLIFSAYIFNDTNVYAAAAKPNSCESEKIVFKKLYLELQALHLNYEGQDSVVDEKGNLKIVPHDKTKPEYEGKLFEAAVFSQYQNSLKKVAKLYQTAKFSNDNKLNQEVPGLVNFLKALEGDSTDFLQNNTIGNVLNDLQKASSLKFNGPDNKKFAITNDDKYLLKKLLTHAQDRLCSVESYERTGKRTALFDAEYLKKVRNAPLNRLIGALKSAKIGAESDLIVDEKTAIGSAIAEHVAKLGEWMKKNIACRKAITNPSFLQANVQPCNYNKFLGVLAGENPENVPPPGILDEEKLDKFQAILHFINANERLLNRPQAKAETALDELKLESYIDSTFANLGQRIGCTEVKNPNGTKRIFVRNLPFINNDFDRSKLTCKIKNKALSPTECKQKIEFVSDVFGRGVEVRQKEKTGPVVTFSLTENPDCNDLSTEQPRKPITLTDEICAEKGKKETPPRELILSEDKKTCIEKPVILTDAICAEKGKKETPPRELILSEDKKSCVEKPVILTDAICAEKGKKETPPRELILSVDKKSCIEKPVILTDAICAEKGKKETPPRELILSVDKKSCVEKPVDNQAQKDCEKKNEEWKKASGKERGIRYSWNEDKKLCEDTKPEQTEAVERAEKDDSIPIDTTPKQVPSSFVPINIPTRQMSILPGMP